MTTLGSITLSLLRIEYRLARLPFRLFDDLVMSVLDDGAPSRLAYERLLADCDRAAAYLLDDENAAARAEEFRNRSAAVRYAIAREQRRLHERGVIVLDEQRARFECRRRPHYTGADPT